MYIRVINIRVTKPDIICHKNQRKRRAAKKAGKNIKGKDYDHTKKKFVSVKANRGGHGKGTKKNNCKCKHS